MAEDKPILVWFRQDLRLHDNPAWHYACSQRKPVIPVFIWDRDGEDEWPMGAASSWWLHHSLVALQNKLGKKNVALVIRTGKSYEAILKLIQECGAEGVCWNRRYEPAAIRRDQDIKEKLHNQGFEAVSFNSHLLFEPWEIKSLKGEPFRVFTPFWKTCLKSEFNSVPLPVKFPAKIYPRKIASISLEALGLLPKIKWDHGFYKTWMPGEEGAQKKLARFLSEALDNYHEGRDLPGISGTSRLSPHLHFGEISPRVIWQEIHKQYLTMKHKPAGTSVAKYISEMGWREFSYHLLYHFPRTIKTPLQQKFERFPWLKSKSLLKSWQRGMTGYPIVDAGMRELWSTGWMHNRVRMIVASFLVKHLLIDWREGARWFWDTLVDADLASNSMGWQWVSGCGADAAPYFRIFNPVLQGEKFDPKGHYVRHWVPEIAKLPDKYLHKPWEASKDMLQSAGIQLGNTYPKPVVDHGHARARALQAFASIKDAKS